MSEKKEIRATVEASTASFIAKYADKNELGIGEALDKLVGTAESRLAALARYAKNQKAEGAPKKPRAKKAAKPKGEKKPRKPKKAAEHANGAAQPQA